ncbi:Tyrosine--tRNA ligase [Trichostrongylus colubriformis]|uniref:Tyrosine--tRNA ligase n=1 Tax=Trichostrongylus colubriformis TaxID=6319 RepID=A0AAN8J3Q3_TRICO
MAFSRRSWPQRCGFLVIGSTVSRIWLTSQYCAEMSALSQFRRVDGVSQRCSVMRFRHLCKQLSTSTLSCSPIANYFSELKTRGLVQMSYPSNLDTDFKGDLLALPPVAYAGFDPTAKSLHIGNLLIVVNLLRSAQFGVRPIAVVGGATALIGDPSGRSAERETQDKDILMENAKTITAQLKSIGNNVLKEEITVVDNNEWFKEMPMVDYLRNCKQLRVGEMLRMGAVRARLEGSGISFTEFSYQTMQAYDWAMLLKKYDCRFQIGGSDQLGHLNIGAHYIKRTCGEKFAAGVCLPLVTDSAGNKLGKSVGGGDVWLSAELTSPFHFYQFLRQLHDTEAEQMYKLYSLAPWEDVLSKIQEHRSNLGKWIAQDALAIELTQIVHGNEGLCTAQRCSRALFQGSMTDVRSLSRTELVTLFGNTIKVARSEVGTMGDLADRTRTDSIKGSALMTKGAFKVNGEKIIDNTTPLVFERIVLPNANDLTLICWGGCAEYMSAGRAHSKLQLLVLKTYRDFLRAARPLDQSVRQQVQTEFREAAKRYHPSDILLIEHNLRRANNQLKQLKTGSVTSIGNITIKRKQENDGGS